MESLIAALSREAPEAKERMKEFSKEELKIKT